MKINKLIQTYLNNDFESDGLEAASRGLEKTKEEIAKEKKNLDNRFILRLDDNSKFNNRMIIVFFVILFLLFFLFSFLIWTFREDLSSVLILLSGEGFSMSLILARIHQLYKDKVFTDQLLYILPEMKTEAEKIKFLEVFKDWMNHKG